MRYSPKQRDTHTHTHTFNSPPLKMEKKKTGGNSTFENYSLNSEEEDEEEEERRAKENFPSSSPSDAGDHQRTHRPRVVASSMLRQVQVSCDSSPSLTRARVVGRFQLAPSSTPPKRIRIPTFDYSTFIHPLFLLLVTTYFKGLLLLLLK